MNIMFVCTGSKKLLMYESIHVIEPGIIIMKIVETQCIEFLIKNIHKQFG